MLHLAACQFGFVTVRHLAMSCALLTARTDRCRVQRPAHHDLAEVASGYKTAPVLTRRYTGCRESGGGQLGLDSDFDFWSPTQVPAIVQLHRPGATLAWKPEGSEDFDRPAWRAVQVSAGFNHTAAVIEMAATVE